MGFYFGIYVYRVCTIMKNVGLNALRANGVLGGPEFKWMVQNLGCYLSVPTQTVK